MAEKDEALLLAIKKVGTGDALAAGLEITPQAISQWKRVPFRRVLEVERLTGIPRHIQRPDLYPPPNAPKNPSADSTADRASQSDQRPTPDTARSLEPGEAGASVVPADGDVDEHSLQDPSEVRA
ncbi:Cro/CI family transcriptional regulator [Bradyrhizobium elkanii]|uniref:transcriptional regulator n=1 Tax=Bradyrhizobium elkanii TaxID=29448 RepID=UPI001022951B|nr:Cro/CI family transcriptional regulator [Bradyrhizobium elkanii]NWL38094.1 helix-turn-helix domain-containing protein [Bradyrhizobium elkanii]RYM15741.1 hypothetical protein EWH13_38535 [Bradyrhizobium elkanii]RYM17307.1 hypothetical protein EWH13_38195 [Bradyrhizobium elkanii]WLB12165.1 Cro/CI family transcriptional regulator [Bradyrhizobium elkanii]WLB70179.1 Cro/CI family transcriptional regulator [Bradyrhizobium elkanii]